MAYDISELAIITNKVNSDSVPNMYLYYNSAGDTVTATGYFDNASLAVGDIIQELSADYTVLTFYRVSAVASNAATVLALTTVTP
ncbi:MAG: hypothetical protein GY861_15965 [bacterium]|nr:hypothetical protein [bacterium]